LRSNRLKTALQARRNQCGRPLCFIPEEDWIVQEIRTNSETASDSARARLPKLVIAPAWGWAITLFLGYRVLWTVWAAWVSSVYPQYQPEQALPIWPIAAPLGVWLER